MRPLTSEERATMNRRKDDFPEVMADIPRMIKELADGVGLQGPGVPVERFDELLTRVDEAIQDLDTQSLDEEAYLWLLTRLGYFAGEFLARRHQGHWMLQTDPDADFFLRYVVSGFEGPLGANTTVDPMHLAENILRLPTGRSLLNEIERLGSGSP
jgi:hypothetical protein